MKYYLGILLVGLCFFPSRSSATESPLLTLFLPAILAAANNDGPISCIDIAGYYFGINSDNSLGYSTSGEVKIYLNNECSFSGVAQNLVKFSGEMRERDGNVLSGYGTATGDGTSSFALNCSVQSGTMSCNYSGSDGLNGRISNAKQGGGETDNRFLTETLAGRWQFSFSIGSSPYVETFALDPASVEPVVSYPGAFIINGVNKYNGPVFAGYDPYYGLYSLYNPGSIIDEQFIFNYNDINKVEGCYYLYSYSSGTWSYCYSMTGIRY